jgi:hypothetical protein
LQHPLTGWVEEVHHGAIVLLAHWHYFKRCNLMELDWDNMGKSPLRFLEPYQVRFVRRIVDQLEERCKYPFDGCQWDARQPPEAWVLTQG